MLSSFYTEVSYAWLVGTQAVTLTALELTGRLAALMPLPGKPTVRQCWLAHLRCDSWRFCAEPFVAEVGG
jgi:hypothetical protein